MMRFKNINKYRSPLDAARATLKIARRWENGTLSRIGGTPTEKEDFRKRRVTDFMELTDSLLHDASKINPINWREKYEVTYYEATDKG